MSLLNYLQHDEDYDDINGSDGESLIREEFSKKGNIHGLCGQNPGHLVSRFLTHLNLDHYKLLPEQRFGSEGTTSEAPKVQHLYSDF